MADHGVVPPRGLLRLEGEPRDASEDASHEVRGDLRRAYEAVILASDPVRVVCNAERSITTSSPGWLSSRRSSMRCSSATAATRLSPRPLPGVERLWSRRK